MNTNLTRAGFLKAVGLLVVSLAIASLPMTACTAKGLDPVANWPALKALLHSQADSKAVTLRRGASLTLDANDAVLAPDLSLLHVDSINGPTVVVPANGVLTFAVDVTETMYVSGAVSIAADPADIRPGLRAYVLSDTSVVGTPMIYQQAPTGGQIDFNSLGKMPDKKATLRTWRLEPGRHYLSVAGPHCRAAGTFESIELQGLDIVPQTPEYTFALLTDTHLGDVGEPSYKSWSPHRGGPSALQLSHTLKALQQEGISFAIHAGDMTDTSKDGQFQQLAETIKASGGLEVYGCIGNHDAYLSTARPAAVAIPGLFPGGSTNYVLNKGPIRFIVVDGSYWQTKDDEWLDYFDRSKVAGIGMRPEDKQWLIDTLAADTTTPTVVVSHYVFQISPGETQCGYTMDAVAADYGGSGSQINDIISAAPNVIATLSGHTHFNHMEAWQNNFGDDIVSIIGPSLVNWPGAYLVFRVYLNGEEVFLEWETRLVDNMGYVLTSNYDLQGQPDDDTAPAKSLAGSWAISTSYGVDLVSDPFLPKSTR